MVDMAENCGICKLSKHPLANFCKRCKKIMDRICTRRKRDKDARIKALKESWDGECFRCYYSGVKLDEKNHHSPLYITFDHRIPRKEDDIVIAAAVINDMKSDLSEDEFKDLVNQLFAHFRKGVPINKNAFKLKHWKR